MAKDPLAAARDAGRKLLKDNPELAKKLAEREEARQSGRSISVATVRFC